MNHVFEVRDSKVVWSGFRFAMVEDQVAMPGGGTAQRIYLDHPGAVVVAALDADDRIALIHQYRHPVRGKLWELPAGLRDVAGEDPAVTAERELGEETDTRAATVSHLLTFHPTPGCSNERIEVFVARDLSPVPGAERHVRTDEEADLELRWWDLDEAVAAVYSGQITNGCTVAGLLAVSHQRRSQHSL
ncbi:MAG: NUDIX domain-containing protein [Stackebrandtia sp.]